MSDIYFKFVRTSQFILCEFQNQFENFQILLGNKALNRLSWLDVETNELFLIPEFLISICLIATVAAEIFFRKKYIKKIMNKVKNILAYL